RAGAVGVERPSHGPSDKAIRRAGDEIGVWRGVVVRARMRKWCPRVLLAALVLGVGCGPKFYKPGATEMDFARDSYECEHDPVYVQLKTLAATTPGYGPGIQARRMYQECLVMKGWQKQ